MAGHCAVDEHDDGSFHDAATAAAAEADVDVVAAAVVAWLDCTPAHSVAAGALGVGGEGCCSVEDEAVAVAVVAKLLLRGGVLPWVHGSHGGGACRGHGCARGCGRRPGRC